MAQATTTTEVTYYSVVWGDDEADRITYTDHGDGSFISRTAEARANSTFLRLIRDGVACGFWTNGTLVAGQNLTGGPDQRPAVLDDPELYAKWVAGEVNDDGTPKTAAPVQHKTRTVMDAYQDERYVTKSNGSCGRYVKSDTSVALCTCGWKYHAGTRDEARAQARVHRLEAGETAISTVGRAA